MKNIFSKELRQEVWYTIKTNKRRTLFTSLGVFAGMFFFTLLTGLGNGIRNGINNSMSGAASDMVMIMPGRTTMPYMGYKANRFVTTDYSDYEYLTKRVNTVRDLAATASWGGIFSSPMVKLNGKSFNNTVMGVSETYIPNMMSDIVLYGRNMKPEEIKQGAHICTIGEGLAEKYFGANQIHLAVGELLVVDGVPFRIVGITTPTNDAINMGFDAKLSVLVPIKVATNADPNAFTLIYYTPKEGLDKEAAEKQILPLLFQRHYIDPTDEKAFSTFSMETFLAIFESIERIINVLIWVIGLGTLFSGVISVSNILLVTVRERQREIGVRRAIGAKPADIRQQFMMEAVFIILMAGMAGLVFGLLLDLGIGAILENIPKVSEMIIRPYPSIQVLIFSLVIMGISGVLAGLLPVYKALQIKAIDAIRDE